jgi:hypothetical protein
VLRLLLDAHISPEVARGVRRHRPDCEIIALRDWEDGAYLDEPDDGKILDRALVVGYTLLTRDLKTIRPLLVAWHAEKHTHGGVIFVDRHTIAERDVGGLIRAVVELWDEKGELDWERRVEYLRRPR